MHRMQLHAQRVRNGLIDLVPGQGFIRGDLERLPDGLPVSHKADKPAGKVPVPGHGPEGRPVALNDHGLFFLHPLNDLPETVISVNAQGNRPLVIGMAGTDNGHREAFLPILFHQELLAGNLVPGVFPVRIGQRRTFRDAVIGRGRLISGSGTDIDILAGFAAEEPVIPLHLVPGETDELTDRVKAHVLQQSRHIRLPADVRDDLPDAVRNLRLPVPPVQQEDFPIRFSRQASNDTHTDGSRASDKKRLHMPFPPCCFSFLFITSYNKSCFQSMCF